MPKSEHQEYDSARRLRTELREISQKHEEPLTPRILNEESRISFTELIDAFGSVAAAAIKSGVDYHNPDPRDLPIAILGEEWKGRTLIEQRRARRMKLLREYRGSIKRDPNPLTKEFGTADAVRIEAGTIDRDSSDWTATSEYIARLRKVANELGHPPTQEYRTIRFEQDDYIERFGSWESALRAAAFDPAKQSRRKELATHLQELANQIGHPPTATEIDEYQWEIGDYGMPSVDCYESMFPDLESAWELAGLPPVRDLRPEEKLQPNGTIEGLPTHTELLAELYCVLRPQGEELQPIEELFGKRGTIDRYHYTVQFGSLENAFKALTQIDERYLP